MRKIFKTLTAAALVTASVLAVSACADESLVVNENLTKAADNFEVNRRVVFFNGITDSYLLSIEGLCSITDDAGQLEVICLVGPKEYKKHFLGLSDNVSYFVEQVEGVEASAYHYRVTFAPEQIIPDIDLRTS